MWLVFFIFVNLALGTCIVWLAGLNWIRLSNQAQVGSSQSPPKGRLDKAAPAKHGDNLLAPLH